MNEVNKSGREVNKSGRSARSDAPHERGAPRRRDLHDVAGLGSVAPSLREFQSDLFRTAGGIGLRYALTTGDRLNIRVDHGWGRAVSGTYFTVGEAF